MRRLVAWYGADSRRFVLAGDVPAAIGSAPENDFVVPFPGVSRRHARAEPVPDGVTLVDLGSKNGLVVRGERRERVALRPGDRVVVGRAVVVLEEVSTADLDLALVLEAPEVIEPRPASVQGSARDTAPHWALRLVRDLETLAGGVGEARRSAVLAEVAAGLGAVALWTFVVVEGDLFLRDCVGAVPSEDFVGRVAETLLREDPPRSQAPVELEDPSGWILVCPAPRGAGPILVTRYPPGRRPESWVADLQVHLAERLRLVEGELSGEDLPALVRHFVLQAGARYGKRIRGVGRRALEILQARRWDGRLRELEHAIEGAVLRCPEGGAVEAAHLPDLERVGPGAEAVRGGPETGEDTLVTEPFVPLGERLAEAERAALREALARSAGDRDAAARLLGITRESLDRRLVRLGLL